MFSPGIGRDIDARDIGNLAVNFRPHRLHRTDVAYCCLSVCLSIGADLHRAMVATAPGGTGPAVQNQGCFCAENYIYS